MDSNSSSPFLGLQLSVDAGADRRAADNPVRTASLSRVSESDHVTRLGESGADREFVLTSDDSRQTSSLKYSLPPVDLKSNPDDAAEVADIMARI